MLKKSLYLILLPCVLALSGCVAHTPKDDKANLTIGKVQQQIKVGLSSAEVVEILGSPNLVSTDEKRREVWVYDRVSRESRFESSGVFGSLLILGGSSNSQSASSSQKTLTIIIKFDEKNKVRDFSYQTSKF